MLTYRDLITGMYTDLTMHRHICIYIATHPYKHKYKRARNLTKLFLYVCIYEWLSLGMLVTNSRDQHEKKWRLNFTHHKTHPKIHFV